VLGFLGIRPSRINTENRIPPVYRRHSGKKGSCGNAQGIEAEIPQALPQVKPRNWSGKPGFRRRAEGSAPEMRPKEEDANCSSMVSAGQGELLVLFFIVPAG
jgi:hypothetical protein